MKRFSMNSSALVHVQLEQVKHSTTWGQGEDKPHLEPRVVSHGDAELARGKPAFLEQEPEQSGSSEAEQGAAEELDAEAQMCSMTEDIAQQI
jgi:hypothetical protein